MIKSETKIYDGIEVRAQKPLDVRSIVETREDLYKLKSWPHDSYVDENGVEHHTIYMKEGMIVTVTGNEETGPIFELYVLTNLSKILEKDYSGWKFIGGLDTGNGGNINGGLSASGNIDGGRANERFAPSQIIDGGHENGAVVRGETDDE